VVFGGSIHGTSAVKHTSRSASVSSAYGAIEGKHEEHLAA
jgi:hypothetical protein